MADELRHKATASTTHLYSTDWVNTTSHIFNDQVANDILYASSATQLSRLAVAASRILGRESSGGLAALTAAEVKTLLGVAAASGIASLNSSTKVVEQPASITDFLEASPTNGLTTKAPNSNWAFDHDADATAHQTKTKEFFVPVSLNSAMTGTHAIYGNCAGVRLNAATELCYIESFRVPADFATLTAAEIIVIPVGTGNVDWTVDTAFAAVGEARNTHTDQVTENTYAVVDTKLTAFDVTAAFTNLGAGDNVGTKVTLDSAPGDYFDVLFLRFKYA